MTTSDDEPAFEWPSDLNLSVPDSALHRDVSVVMRSVRDFDGYVVSASPSYCAMLGWSIKEMSSVPYWELLHPDDQHRTVERSQRMLLSGPGSIFDLEVRMLHRDGTYRWACWTVRSDPREERVYSVGVEITDREPIETEKRVLVGFWDWHIPTNTVIWSDGMFEIYRLAPGPTCSLEEAVARLHVDDQLPVMRAIRWSLASEEPYVADHRIVHPNGDIRWIHSAGRVITGENGDPERMRGITQDVTSRPAAYIPG